MPRPLAVASGALALAVVVVAAVAVGGEVVRYFEREIAPAIAEILTISLLVALGCASLFFLWHFCADPTRRLAERARDAVDYRLERARVAAELQRRIDAIDEEESVRAMTASARVHENAARAVSEGRLRLELEELKGRSEQVVMRAQAADLARMLARYEAALWRLKTAPHMTEAEKTRLLAEIRGLLADEAGLPRRAPASTPAPAPAIAPTARRMELLEYREPGGEPVTVSADGLRRLLERGRLSADDECRRVGVTEWASVAEILRSHPPA